MRIFASGVKILFCASLIFSLHSPQAKVAFHFKKMLHPLSKKVARLQGHLQSPYNRVSCKNLDTYAQYLKELIEKEGPYGSEGAKPRSLLKHKYCNAAAVRMAKKSYADQEEWNLKVEHLFRQYFGHPSGLFIKNKSAARFLKNAAIGSPVQLLQELQEKYKHMNTIFILSIDGGGIRGIIPATILSYIQEQAGIKITDAFQFYIGTSTGGLIVLFLNTPDRNGKPRYDIKQTIKLYKELGEVAFDKGALHRRIRGMGGVLTSKYSVKPLEHLLRSKFHDYTMAQTINPVTVVSINQSTRQPFLFSTFDALVPSLHKDFFIWQAGRATSAAPTFFKPFTLKYRAGNKDVSLTLIDGGVGINNPALEAFSSAKHIFGGKHKKYIVLSLGTGTPRAHAKVTSRGSLSGGAATSLGSIISNFGDSSANFNNSVLKRIVESDGGFFVRINPILKKKEAAMDNASPKNIRNLEAIAKHAIRDHQTEIDVLVEIIKKHAEVLKLNPASNNEETQRLEREVQELIERAKAQMRGAV